MPCVYVCAVGSTLPVPLFVLLLHVSKLISGLLFSAAVVPIKQLIMHNLNAVLTLDDSTAGNVPAHLLRMVHEQSTAAIRRTKSDLLAMLVYVAAVECGFVTITHAADLNATHTAKPWASFHCDIVRKHCDRLPCDYRNETINGYLARLILLQLSERNGLLIARDIGDGLCVTFSVQLSNGEHLARSMYLSAGRYVLRTTFVEASFANCVQNLKELSYRVKNELFMPIRIALLTDELVFDECRKLFAGLLGLPNELLLKMLAMLTAEERKPIREASSVLKKLCDELSTSRQSAKKKRHT